MPNLRTSIAVLLASSTVACSSVGSPGRAAPGGAPDSGATAAQVSLCKQSCDRLKFFMCNDAAQQATCYADCEAATASEVELFDACVQNATCDPACSTHLKPAPASTPEAGAGPVSGGGDGGGVSGGGDGGGVDQDPTVACKDACGHLSFFSCISGTEETACENLCDASPQGKRDAFASCEGSAGLTGTSTCPGEVQCYQAFNPNAPTGPTPADVSACQKACDDLAFFACLGAHDQTTCRNKCASEASATNERNFTACAESNPTDCTKGAACYADW